jgi:hypothetical protein
MTCGTILFHEKFKFTDGEHGKKLLIILNTPSKDEPYLICKTTSKCKYSITKEGCHSDKGIYHIKANFDGFLDNTWVQLDSITEITKEELLNAHFSEKVCKPVHCLKDTTIKAILNCIKKGDDFSQYQADLMFH